ncbi:hypothetical protein STSO111631_21135 [Stackebrandtia soli]
MLRRRRRSVLLAVLLLAATAALSIVIVNNDPDTAPTSGDVAAAAPESSPSAPPTSASPSPSPTPGPEDVVYEGDGEWTYAKVESDEPIGDDGQLMRFNIAVEGGLGADRDEFTDVILDTFGDERGWTAAQEWRFEMVGKGQSDFTLYLASPATRQSLCGDGDDYTSCRNGNSVVINYERWVLGVPHWDESIEDYRHYVINHEVGHRLGEGHVVCPKKGDPSPVMAQQTLQLGGCEPNAWPYVDGEYITGPMGEYG